jgi:hypothetical protein
MTMLTKWNGERVIIRSILLDGLRSVLNSLRKQDMLTDYAAHLDSNLLIGFNFVNIPIVELTTAVNDL